MILKGSEAWVRDHARAVVGMLVMRGVSSVAGEGSLAVEASRLEAELRSRYPDSGSIKADATLQAYRAYYKRFDKTYHVSQQLESIALKGKSIPAVIPLVRAFFMAELKNLILSAGHDLAALTAPFEVGSATAEERYVTMRGEERSLKTGDMRISDGQGVISSVILGPDQRSKITAETRDAAFFAYAPAGIDEQRVRAHLCDIRDYVRAFSPQATADALEVVRAG